LTMLLLGSGARRAGAAPSGGIGLVGDVVLLLRCSGARRAGAAPSGGISFGWRWVLLCSAAVSARCAGAAAPRGSRRQRLGRRLRAAAVLWLCLCCAGLSPFRSRREAELLSYTEQEDPVMGPWFSTNYKFSILVGGCCDCSQVSAAALRGLHPTRFHRECARWCTAAPPPLPPPAPPRRGTATRH
jgi:hypothetical protein